MVDVPPFRASAGDRLSEHIVNFGPTLYSDSLRPRLSHPLTVAMAAQLLVAKSHITNYSRVINDEHHMSPKGKPQPSEQEITLLRWWIDKGLDFDKKVKEIEQTDAVKAIFATLLLDFDFSLTDAADEYMDDHSGMTVKPKAPMTVRFTRKKK